MLDKGRGWAYRDREARWPLMELTLHVGSKWTESYYLQLELGSHTGTWLWWVAREACKPIVVQTPLGSR